MNLTQTTTSTDAATYGTLQTDTQRLFSIEQPWRDNLPGHSCIPAGTYALVWYVSPRHGGTYCFRNPDLKIMGCDALTAEQVAQGYRTLCEMHSANWAEQLEGCSAYGLEGHPSYDPITKRVEPAVEESADAVKALLAELGENVEGHTITIARSF